MSAAVVQGVWASAGDETATLLVTVAMSTPVATARRRIRDVRTTCSSPIPPTVAVGFVNE